MSETSPGRLRRLAGRLADAPERGGLGRDEVVRTALALLDEVGLDGLSMRRLAEGLGVQAASLYWHLQNKEELLDLLADAIYAEVPAPRPDRPWREQLEAFAWGYRRVLLAHRDAGQILARRLGAGSFELMEGIVALLLRAGFSPEDAAEAGSLVLSFVPRFTSDVASPAPAAGPTPVGGVQTGRLELAGGASRIALRAGPAIEGLYEARFEDRQPDIRVHGGTVRIVQHHGRRGGGEVSLNTTIPWEVVVNGGAWGLTADLRGVMLASFEVNGGASRIDLTLGMPSGVVPVRISGGVTKAEVRRPEGAPAQLRVTGGAAKLELDDSSFGAVGGETRLQTPDFPDAADRYEIEVRGGASRLAIRRQAAGDQTPPASTTTSAGGGKFPEVPADRFPSLASLAGHLAGQDADARFRFGLGVLLDGLERRLDTAAT